VGIRAEQRTFKKERRERTGHGAQRKRIKVSRRAAKKDALVEGKPERGTGTHRLEKT